jgi:polysaccharide biosynthesis/export protein
MMARILLSLACSALLGQEMVIPPTSVASTKVDGSDPVAKKAAPPEFQTRHPRYQVATGDVIDLSFSPTAEYNQTVSVQPDGYITLREVGDVYVRGMTVPEMRKAISAAYGKILHDPEITVLLKDFDKPHFTVTGQVGHPGKFELRAETTVSEALAQAGGMTEKSKDSQVLLFRRVSADWAEVKLLDVKGIYKGKFQEDVPLRPGDMLFVPQNRISKIKPYLPVTALTSSMSTPVF